MLEASLPKCERSLLENEVKTENRAKKWRQKDLYWHQVNTWIQLGLKLVCDMTQYNPLLCFHQLELRLCHLQSSVLIHPIHLQA